MNPKQLLVPHDLVNKLVAYKKCRKCAYATKVDAVKVSNACTQCGGSNTYDDPFFDLNLLLVVDLMQDAYITAATLIPGGEQSPVPGEQARLVSVVVYFCTLKELLLHRFLDHFLYCFALPSKFLKSWEKLHAGYVERADKLLPSLVGHSWRKLTTLLKSPRANFDDLDRFLREATRKRNSLLHEGETLDVDQAFTIDCFEHMEPLIEFYVELNNAYVHQMKMHHITRIPQPRAG